MEAVLPRVRARSKRIKPPPPSFWVALCWAAWDVIFGTWDLVWGVVGPSWIVAPMIVMCTLQIVSLRFVSWPRLMREWRAWRDQ